MSTTDEARLGRPDTGRGAQDLHAVISVLFRGSIHDRPHRSWKLKAGGSVGAAFEEFMRAFETYKDANDERLSELERRSASDPLIDDKLARLDRALDDTKRVADALAVKAQRPASR